MDFWHLVLSLLWELLRILIFYTTEAVLLFLLPRTATANAMRVEYLLEKNWEFFHPKSYRAAPVDLDRLYAETRELISQYLTWHELPKHQKESLIVIMELNIKLLNNCNHHGGHSL